MGMFKNGAGRADASEASGAPKTAPGPAAPGLDPALFGESALAEFRSLQLSLSGAASPDGDPALLETRLGAYEIALRLVLPNLVSSAAWAFVDQGEAGALCLCKASGRGLLPALLAQHAVARFRERFGARGSAGGPAGGGGFKAFAESLNDEFAERAPRGRFSSLALGSVSASGELTWLSAGGPPVFHYRASGGTCKKLALEAGPALGTMDSCIFSLRGGGWKLYKLPLARGDLALVPLGDWDEASVPAAVEAAMRPAGSAPNPAAGSAAREPGQAGAPLPDLLSRIMGGLKEEDPEDAGAARQDRYLLVLRRG